MKINRLSGRERGEENLAKVRSYLAGLKAAIRKQMQHPGAMICLH